MSEAFAGGRGRVAVDDTIWIAEAMDASNPAHGETVEIAGVEGAVLKVKLASLKPSSRTAEGRSGIHQTKNHSERFAPVLSLDGSRISRLRGFPG